MLANNAKEFIAISLFVAKLMRAQNGAIKKPMIKLQEITFRQISIQREPQGAATATILPPVAKSGWARLCRRQNSAARTEPWVLLDKSKGWGRASGIACPEHAARDHPLPGLELWAFSACEPFAEIPRVVEGPRPFKSAKAIRFSECGGFVDPTIVMEFSAAPSAHEESRRSGRPTGDESYRHASRSGILAGLGWPIKYVIGTRKSPAFSLPISHRYSEAHSPCVSSKSSRKE